MPSNQIENFIGLIAATGGKPDALTRAKGFLHYYESYTPSLALLDSAIHYWHESDAKPAKKLPVQLHALYLKKSFDQIAQLSNAIKPQELTDACTAYRIGEALLQEQQPTKALPFLEKAVSMLPLQPDFQVKLGVCLLQINWFEEAKTILLQVLKEDNKHVSALTNMDGICRGEFWKPDRSRELLPKSPSTQPRL